MNKGTKKIISVFLLAVFLLVSGPAQLIHAAFHHDYDTYSGHVNKGTSNVSVPHAYCTALQLTLPEFFQAQNSNPGFLTVFKNHFCVHYASPAYCAPFFGNTGRAPPVSA